MTFCVLIAVLLYLNLNPNNTKWSLLCKLLMKQKQTNKKRHFVRWIQPELTSEYCLKISLIIAALRNII